MSDWTPGPWHIADEDFPLLVEGNGRLIADCQTFKEKKHPQDLANARLIAKAPEMAELLRELAEEQYYEPPAIPESVYIFQDRARKLLAEIEPQINTPKK